MGSIAFNNLEKTVLVSSLYVVVKMSETLNNEFVLQYIKSPLFIREVRRNTEGSVREYLFYENFSNIKIPYTQYIEEQKLIGLFFKMLDDTLALHQRKLEQLKRLKQGFLQVLFANEATIPKVRFAGFIEEWEQRKLGDIFKKDTQKNKDLEFHSDSVISVARMKLSPPSAKSSDEYMKTYNKIRRGNIAFEGHTNDKFPNGRFVLNDCQDGIVSHIYDVYSAVEEYDNEFMKRYINNPDVMRKILINATSSARMMKSLNSVEFLKQSILLPILSEQQQIGKFFYQLDNTLTLHQKKLSQLKNLKKGLLQSMFI
ncbi:type I restriction enzyme, S subunit [Enterococcus sp. AZ062]